MSRVKPLRRTRAHQWVHSPNDLAHFQKPQTRTCSTCGAAQEYVVEQSWGRVVSRRWLPLVGRCKGTTRA